VRDAIQALQQRQASDALTLEQLRLSIAAGIASLDHGEYALVENAELLSTISGRRAWDVDIDRPTRAAERRRSRILLCPLRAGERTCRQRLSVAGPY
jgi:hypothetical protein